MNNIIKIYLITGILALSLSPLNVFAGPQCVELFHQQNSIEKRLEASPVAIGEVSITNKKLPVILVNKNSISSLDPIYKKSLGFVVTHQKGYNNDHGLLRLGDYFIDRDTPGYRSRGEINSTGISWASVKEYTDYSYRKNRQPPHTKN